MSRDPRRELGELSDDAERMARIIDRERAREYGTPEQIDAGLRRRLELIVVSAYGTLRVLHAAGVELNAERMHGLATEIARELVPLATRWEEVRGPARDD